MTAFSQGEDGRWRELGPVTDLHVNCRCEPVPVPRQPLDVEITASGTVHVRNAGDFGRRVLRTHARNDAVIDDRLRPGRAQDIGRLLSREAIVRKALGEFEE